MYGFIQEFYDVHPSQALAMFSLQISLNQMNHSNNVIALCHNVACSLSTLDSGSD